MKKNTIKLKSFILAMIFIMTVFTGCVSTTEENKETGNSVSKKLSIVASIFPEYDFARAIAGDKADIFTLIPPGSSVHSFDPSPSDMLKVQSADVFIYIGGGSDAWADNVLASLDTSKMKIVKLMSHVNMMKEEIKEGMTSDEEDEHQGNTHGEDELEYDEHIWTSPKNAIKLIDVICGAIIEKDSENTEFYRANAKKYQDELKAVDAEIETIIANAKRRKIIVADKFPFLYFVNQYGLDYEAAFPGCSDQADAGAKTIVHLVNSIVNENIPYIYYVELSNKNVATAVSEQTGAKMLLFNSCHNLSLEEFDKGATYLSLMKDNAENLRKGLN